MKREILVRTPSPPKMRSMRVRTVFCVAEKFSQASSRTQKNLLGVLDELKDNTSRTSTIVDAYEGVASVSSEDAANSAVQIYMSTHN